MILSDVPKVTSFRHIKMPVKILSWGGGGLYLHLVEHNTLKLSIICQVNFSSLVTYNSKIIELINHHKILLLKYSAT